MTNFIDIDSQPFKAPKVGETDVQRAKRLGQASYSVHKLLRGMPASDGVAVVVHVLAVFTQSALNEAARLQLTPPPEKQFEQNILARYREARRRVEFVAVIQQIFGPQAEEIISSIFDYPIEQEPAKKEKH